LAHALLLLRGKLLGELIVAVTDKVMPFVHDPSLLYLVVSDVLTFLCRAIDSWLASG
jgi:hypothetical protein